jgi:hypothetical protein
MPLQNRVTPLGELIEHPAHGLVYGNRGCLHDGERRLRRAWQVKRWIACRLEFKGRTRELMQPGRYTELFFLDEATAFAAGHRPCAECRRADYDRFVGLVGMRADAVDERLHGERLDGAGRRLHRVDAAELPDGAFVHEQDEAWLVLGDELRRWTPAGYADRRPRPEGETLLITPPTLVAVLRAGWQGEVAFLHPSATL